MSWEYTVGMLPHRVVAYEDTARKGVIYLRWRIAGDWKRKSLGFRFVRDRKGRIPKAEEDKARRAADEQYAKLASGGHVPAAPTMPLTIAEGWTLATDAERGRWTSDTMHRREMRRATDRAKSVWGASTAWNAIDRGEVRRLWRAELKRVRAKGHDGARSAEIVITRVMTLAAWLREEGKILPTACVPWKAMRSEMLTDVGAVEVHRPRYTIDEYRRMLAAAWQVDERFGFLLAIGAEYRLGQVVRVRRVHIDPLAGTVQIVGAGKKRGAVIQLTGQQIAAMQRVLADGYLAGLETAFQAGEVADYPVFVGVKLPVRDGRLVTRADHATRSHLDRTPLQRWLRATETLAKVDHMPGRGWYGLRRVAVDAAKAAGISREGLQQSGGWSNTQVPDAIYADQNAAYAREEAARIRSSIRAELPAETEQNGASPTGEGEACGPSNSEEST